MHVQCNVTDCSKCMGIIYVPCTTTIFNLLCTTSVRNKYIVLKVNTSTKIPCFFEYADLAVLNQMH